MKQKKQLFSFRLIDTFNLTFSNIWYMMQSWFGGKPIYRQTFAVNYKRSFWEKRIENVEQRYLLLLQQRCMYQRLGVTQLFCITYIRTKFYHMYLRNA